MTLEHSDWIAGGVLALTAACAPAVPAGVASEEASIAAIHQRTCARCHALPEPKTRSRDYLERAAARHRKRLRLDDDQWRMMIDYLEASGATGRIEP